MSFIRLIALRSLCEWEVSQIADLVYSNKSIIFMMHNEPPDVQWEWKRNKYIGLVYDKKKATGRILTRIYNCIEPGNRSRNHRINQNFCIFRCTRHLFQLHISFFQLRILWSTAY